MEWKQSVALPSPSQITVGKVAEEHLNPDQLKSLLEGKALEILPAFLGGAIGYASRGMQHVSVLGLTLEYRDFPATCPGSPTILMLHEGLGCVAMWGQFPQRLAAATGCRVLVWSRAGYGGSQPYAEPRSPRYLHHEALEAVPALADALGVERAILVGHSDGGSIALIHAGAFPERVQALAVMAPHAFVEEEALGGIREAVVAWRTTDLPTRLGRYHADANRVFLDWSGTWLSVGFRDWNIAGSLAGIRCPILAIQGEEDEYGTLRQIELLARTSRGQCCRR
jgi:pimeloyl-ACP methyl ester carboxylesterase